jgi:uncharacterized protein YhjY with autotransporter beta-barrel domain/mono/diheme cytochrome c family protein
MASFSDRSTHRTPHFRVPTLANPGAATLARRGLRLAAFALGVFSAALSVQSSAQQTSGSAATGATLWAGGNCVGCHGALPNTIYQAPKNAANAGGVILNANNNFMGGLVAGAVPPDATQRADLAAYIATFVPAPVAANVPYNSGAPAPGSTAIPIDHIYLGTTYGAFTSLQTANANGASISYTGTTANYTAAVGACGSTSFTYEGAGPAGTSNVRTQPITITAPSAPVATGNTPAAIAYSTMATNVPILLSGTTPTSITITSQPAVGTVTATSATTVSYTASSTAYSSPLTFQYQANGPCGTTSGVATVNLTVNPPPVPAITSAATATGTGGQAFTYNITATNAPTSFGATGLPAWASINTMTGAITGTPTAAGVTNAMISATNVTGTTTVALQITVNLVTPVITSTLTAGATSGSPFAYTITANNLPASFNATGLPTGLMINTMTGAITGTPVVAMGGPVNVMISATNAAGTDTETLVITVSLNAPTITSANTASATSGTAFSFQITATDFPSSYAATGLPTGLSINTMTGLISGTPVVAMTSMFPVMVTATNGSGSANQTLTITVTLAAPTITSSNTASGTVASPFSYQITASGVPTSFNATGLPAGLSVNTTTGLISGTPAVNGVTNAMISATNATGTGSQALTITISNLPAPNAGSFSATVPFNMPATIDLAGAVTGSVTGFAVASQPTKGTLTLSGSTVTYTPNAGYFGPDSFTYTASGPGGTSGVATVSLTVSTPGAPTAGARAATVAFNAPTAIDLTSSITGVSTSITITVAPLNGTVTVNGKIATYTPNKDYFGADSFSYTATGPGGTSMPAVVTITVATQAPTAESVNFILPLNTPTTLDLAPFIKGSAISGIVVVASPGHGTASVNGTKVTYSPAKDFFGPDTFTYSAFGNAGTSPAATVRVTVVGRPDPTKDTNVTSLISAQIDTAKRFSTAQIANFQSRLESLHRSGEIGVAPMPSANTPPAPVTPSTPPSTTAAPVRSDVVAGKPGSYLHASVADASGKGASSFPFAGELASLVASRSFNVASLIDASTDPVATGGGGTMGPPRFWISGIANFGKRLANSQNSDLDFSTDGVSLGVDRRFNGKFAAGVGVGFARDRTDIGTDGSRSRARGVSAAIYGSYHPSSNTFVDGLIGAGSLNFKTQRYVTPIDAYASGERKGNQFFASLAAGYEFRESGKLLSPYLRLDYTSERLKQSSETGAGQYALTYFSQTTPSLQGVAGVRAESFNQTNYGWVTPRARLELRHEFQKARDSSIAYADLAGGPRFTFSSGAVSRNSLVAGIGADFIRRSGLTIGIDYQVLHNFSHDTNQGIRLNFTQDLDKLGMPHAVKGFFVIPQKPEKIQLDVGYMFDSNVTRAKEKPDKRYDRAYSVNVGKGFVFKPDDDREDIRALVTYTLGGEKFQNYDGLSRAIAGVEGEFQYRTSADFDAVTFALFGRANAESFRSKLRRGYRYSVGFSARQSLTDKIDIFGAISHNERIGRSGVFNGRDNSVRLNLDYTLNDRETLYATAEYRRGHVVSTGSPSLENLAVADVFVLDDAYPGSLFSYRFDGRTVVSTIGYNLGFGPRHSVDMSWRRAQSTPDSRPSFATSPKSYIADQYSIVYLVRF